MFHLHFLFENKKEKREIFKRQFCCPNEWKMNLFARVFWPWKQQIIRQCSSKTRRIVWNRHLRLFKGQQTLKNLVYWKIEACRHSSSWLGTHISSKIISDWLHILAFRNYFMNGKLENTIDGALTESLLSKTLPIPSGLFLCWLNICSASRTYKIPMPGTKCSCLEGWLV